MENKVKYSLITTFALCDILVTGLIYSLSFKIDNNSFEFSIAPNFEIFKISILTWCFSALAAKPYKLNTNFITSAFYRSTWVAFGFQFILLYTYVYLFTKPFAIDLNETITLLHFSSIVIYMLLSRVCITYWIENLKPLRIKSFKTAIWGFNLTSIKLAEYLEENENLYDFIGIVNENETPRYDNAEQFNTSLSLTISQAVEYNIKELYVVTEPKYLKEMQPHFKKADDILLRLKFIPDFSLTVPASFISHNVDNFQIIKPREEPLEEPINRLKKRVFDLLVSLLVLIFIMSWLFPIIGFIIKYQSPGPIIFKQLRTGINNKEFWCYKFRSMQVNEVSNEKQAQKNDTRLTNIGRFIRKTSIDELPQFFNVLMGNMSVVGPRPHMIKHTKDYNELIDNFMVRHLIKPGITGLSQISGFRGETKRTVDMQNRVNTDIEYLRNWSLINDLKICLLTVIITLNGDEKAF